MRLGIGSYTYAWAVGIPGRRPETPMTAADLVKKANASGLRCIQLADNLPLEQLAADERHALAELAEGRRVTIEVGARRMSSDHLLRLIDVAAFFGSRTLRFAIDGPGYEPSVDDVVKTLRGALPRLRETGVRLALENEDRLLPGELREIVRQTDSEQVGVCLDPVNSLGAGEAIGEVVRALAPHTIDLHLKDFAVRRISHGMGFLVEGAPAGQGMLDIPWLLEQVRGHGRCDSAFLELWTPPEADIGKTIAKEARWADDSLRYLKPLFAGGPLG
jgi:sugar phosphate isomerase/epimerase